MAELKFEIKEHIGTVSESSKGWTKELNIVSWNGANPKFDLRDWAPEHEKMGKGLTFTNEELKNLGINVIAVCPSWVDTDMLIREIHGKKVKFPGIVTPKQVVAIIVGIKRPATFFLFSGLADLYIANAIPG